MSDAYTGGCACGAVRYSIADEPIFMNECQCRDCQHVSGTGHGSYLTFPSRAAVELTGDTSSWDAVADSGNVKTHAFCPRCGSPVHLTFSAMPDVPSSASSFRSFWLLPCPSWGQVSFRASSPVGV